MQGREAKASYVKKGDRQMLKGIKKVCGSLKKATSNHYFLVGCDGKEVWIEEEFIGNGFLDSLSNEYRWEYIYRPMTMKELNDVFSNDERRA